LACKEGQSDIFRLRSRMLSHFKFPPVLQSSLLGNWKAIRHVENPSLIISKRSGVTVKEGRV